MESSAYDWRADVTDSLMSSVHVQIKIDSISAKLYQYHPLGR